MLDFDELHTKLPTANSSFPDLCAQGCVYVDKTKFVYRLAVNKQPHILIRPRCFGKSTLLSALKELFLHGTGDPNFERQMRELDRYAKVFGVTLPSDAMTSSKSCSSWLRLCPTMRWYC